MLLSLDAETTRRPSGTTAHAAPRRRPPRAARATPTRWRSCHPRTTGDHYPAIGAVVDQQRIETSQQRFAPDELLVALPLVPVVEPLPGHPRLAAS